MFNFIFIIAQQTAATSSDHTTLIVAIIGLSTAAISGFYAYRAQKKQSDVQSESQEKISILKERDQLSNEWKALREFQGIQLEAARKEIETLEGQVRVQKVTISDYEKQLDMKNEQIFDLERLRDAAERNQINPI